MPNSTRHETTLRVAMLCAIAIAGVLTLSACNTVKGVGKDVGVAGDAIERAGRN
jgi:predicted small secreted protein